MNYAVRVFLMALLGIIVLLGFSGPASADNASMGRLADGVYPIDDPDVLMVDEDVKLHMEGNGYDAWVECDFTFKNNGEKKEVLMGFPAVQVDPYYNFSDADDDYWLDEKDFRLTDFRTYINKYEIG